MQFLDQAEYLCSLRQARSQGRLGKQLLLKILLLPKQFSFGRALRLFLLMSRFVVTACCEDDDIQINGQRPLLQRNMRLMKSLTAGICAVRARLSALMRVISKKKGCQPLLQCSMCLLRTKNCVAALSRQLPSKIMLQTI